MSCSSDDQRMDTSSSESKSDVQSETDTSSGEFPVARYFVLKCGCYNSTVLR